MLNRRDFLRTVGGTATGAFIMTRLGDALAQSSRREVFVGGQRATTVGGVIGTEVRPPKGSTPLYVLRHPWMEPQL